MCAKSNCIQKYTVNGITFKMKSFYDFSFLGKYGKVFKVFDDQDSGNICFGIEKDGKKYFVKFAGSPTAEYNGNPKDAIERLKAAMPIYQALHHENLIELVNCEDIGDGFAMIFKWTDGDCMGRMYKDEHNRFMQLPITDKLNVFFDILDFLEYVSSNGYVAVDFYDGSIIYDYANKKTTICDIDYFEKMPCINNMGRMFGSAKFMSPEEFKKGAVIDEITNVYTAGAFAFALFGNYGRNIDDWKLSGELFTVASKAVSDNRDERYSSINEFRKAWFRYEKRISENN